MLIRLAMLILSLLSCFGAVTAQSEGQSSFFGESAPSEVASPSVVPLSQLEDECSELEDSFSTTQKILIAKEFERDVRTEGLLTAGQLAELAKERADERTYDAPALGKFLKQFAFLSASMARADELTLFEGLPRGSDDLLNEIKSNHATIEIDGWSFYEKPRELSPAVEYQLRKTLMDYTAFEPYGGPKFCGGFHPDFAVQWSDGDKKYSALVCLTCFEVNYILPNGETIFDFRAPAWKRFALVCLSTFEEHRGTIEKLNKTIGE
jgi:hypothetical protein